MGRWKLYVQLLGGGTKISHVYADLALRTELNQLAQQAHQTEPDYTTWATESDRNGFATVASSVAVYDFKNGLQLRAADFGYQRSWVKDLQGMNYDKDLRFGFGVSYRMGAWRNAEDVKALVVHPKILDQKHQTRLVILDKISD